MTTTTGSAQKIAGEYVRAWLGGDVEKALSFIADDIVCQAPSGQIEGRDGYRQFLAPFASALLSGELVDVLGDGTHAATVYSVETPFAKDVRGMEYLTVKNGKITHAVSVFDLSPMIRASGNPQR
ncbi:MAG: nuclear transport factor 2 family protein [Trebonia sp.]